MESDFNISHSGNWINLAVSECGKIGGDVEGIKPIGFSIAKTFCFQREYAQLQKYDYEQKLTYFYSLWTLKESFVKLVGTRLYYPIGVTIHTHQAKKTSYPIAIKLINANIPKTRNLCLL
ncbi:4'-phosphopantetheinyl transferase family protein [Bacillus sp. NPDC094077]|uniref:4'-phosphopantetheinyl transferase family protein n=1 Tax=Bacillus sp. NPDC094077 TaxID=3390932 RepID=UPI003CFF38BC